MVRRNIASVIADFAPVGGVNFIPTGWQHRLPSEHSVTVGYCRPTVGESPSAKS
ncbi:MAG: hypothetical protein LBC02_12840 [Planctomycetaceae bacterium]|nr:hypothetical protein [Planctomycetaceae bacterium]